MVFRNIPPGFYDVTSHMHALTGEIKKIEVAAGQAVTVDLVLSLSPLREEITVTVSGREVTAFDAFQSVAIMDSVE